MIIITHNKEILRVSDLLLTIENGKQKIFDSMTNIAKQMKENQAKSILERQKKTIDPTKKNNET